MARLIETNTKSIEKTKNDKASWFKLFRLIIIKISYSFITAFLFLFSIIISILSITTLFFLNLSIENFTINLQYYIMIFYSIFLFIFILLNAIKIFGTQFEDSSFLLLLTKPYSRSIIILTQYAALFFMNLIFIFTNIIVLLIFGGISGIIIKVPYLIFYVQTILKLFVFCSLFATLVTVGVVTMLSFTPSQTVFLIFVIFCSLFLLGGLPYSLTKLNSDAINISFQNTDAPFNVSQIKEAILFKQNLKKGLIKYPNLTKVIFDFYSNLSDNELNDIRVDSVINKRIAFYQSLGFIEPKPVVKNFEGMVTSWQPPKFQDQNITMQVTFTSYFKSLNELQENVDNNQVTQDLLNIIDDYDKKYNIDQFMDIQNSKVPWLLTFNENIDDTYIKLTTTTTTKERLQAKEILDIFKSPNKYRFSFRSEFNKMFYNPVYFLIRTTEDYIYTQINTYRKVTTNAIINDTNYKKYIKVANNYQLINSLNFIEHWNQIWTYFMGYYGDFWFEPYATSSINFDTQKNTLFSYPDFKLTLKNKIIKIDDLDYFQNNKFIVEIYSGISIFLFLFSYLMYSRKIVS